MRHVIFKTQLRHWITILRMFCNPKICAMMSLWLVRTAMTKNVSQKRPVINQSVGRSASPHHGLVYQQRGKNTCKKPNYTLLIALSIHTQSNSPRVWMYICIICMSARYVPARTVFIQYIISHLGLSSKNARSQWSITEVNRVFW